MSRDIRLVAVDLDGTLLDSTRSIAGPDRDALRACVEAGIPVAIVTGRRWPSARPHVEALALDVFVVVNSGAIIKESTHGPLLTRQLLPRAIADDVLAASDAFGIEPVVHDGPDGEGHLTLREGARSEPQLERYLFETSPPPTWVTTLELSRDPVQIGFASTVSRIRAFAAKLSSELGPSHDHVTLARTEYPDEDLALLDVLSRRASKSEGLKFLGRHLRIATEQMMAIGDNWNDLDMLETAGLGIVMENASTELHGRGFERTRSNDDAGVAYAIERFVKIEGLGRGGEEGKK